MRTFLLLCLVLGTATVTAVPTSFGYGYAHKVKASGLPLYADLGTYGHGGLFMGKYGSSGIGLYKNLYGNGYYGVHGLWQHAGGKILYPKLGGIGIHGKNLGPYGYKPLGLWAGKGSIMYGGYGHTNGLLSGHYGQLSNLDHGAIFGGFGVPYGGIGRGNLLHGFGIVKKGHAFGGSVAYY
ncbi:shematrin-like protein 2 [Haliotis rubra]|uniref:shematrin-like protein 2 n=1 Tax=Haliotis rubra TaxID=36100 RepID=UPI001EE54483|nr:shematrin-like protein 2 [Haliotis rubra]